MKNMAKIVSWLSLVVLMVPVILFLIGSKIELDTVKIVMNIATIVWFATASIWMWNPDTGKA